MRRRRVLALGAAGLAGCLQVDRSGTTSRSTSRPRNETERERSETTPTEDAGPTTRIGGSVHGRAWRLGDDLDLVEASEANWIHAFLDIRKKLDLDVTPSEDPDVVALRRASEEMGANLFVTLQWNFIGIFGEQPAKNMPPAGSSRERALIEFGTELLEAIDEPVEIVGLGNEPVWETLDGDFMEHDSRLFQFTRALKNHLVEHYAVGDPRYVVGAFNRLYNDNLRREHEPFYRQLYEMARTDDDVDGIDLHIHYPSFEQARRMLDVTRSSFPDGLVTATELSPWWRYDRHKDSYIRDFEGGEAFAERWEVPEDTAVREYFEEAKNDRLSPEEMADFTETMPWYNVNFVEDMHDLLSEYDVRVGTFGFLVEDDVEQLDWTEEWAPFPINCLFQPALIDSEHGANPHYLDDFRRLADGRPYRSSGFSASRKAS